MEEDFIDDAVAVKKNGARLTASFQIKQGI